MFDKTRRKIVFTVVISLLTLLIVTMSTIYLSNLIATRQRQEDILKTYLEQYSPDTAEPLDELPEGELPPPPPDEREPRRDEPKFTLSTFYSVAYSNSGEVIKIVNGNDDLLTDEYILFVASSAVKSGKDKGTAGNLLYMVSQREDYVLVAMIDKTMDNDNQTILLRQILIIGTISTAVLLAVSVFIARRIVRPLEENDKKQKRFVSDAGHELKTPIAVISANAELLKGQIGENEWLSNIEYENERMNDLVRQLLYLSRAENADIPKDNVDLSKLVEGEVLPTETLAYERGKTIVSNVEHGLTTYGNANQLRQLVSILLDNALTYGTGETISLSLKKERHAAILAVSNDADKISADQLKHLFDRFYRTDEVRSGDQSHYGLGLSIAHAIVSAHGGDIRAEYKENKAVFTILLPLKKI